MASQNTDDRERTMRHARDDRSQGIANDAAARVDRAAPAERVALTRSDDGDAAPHDAEPSLHDVVRRLEALERQNGRLLSENHVLRAEMVALKAAASAPAAAASSPAIEHLSRRWLLRRAMQAAAASVAAGVLLQRHDTHPTQASHSTELINAAGLAAHYVAGFSEDGSIGVDGSTTSDSESIAGVNGQNFGTGPGVRGSSPGGTGVSGYGIVGVWGTSPTTNQAGVRGVHTGAGYGVVGDGGGASQAGVLGRNSSGQGVRGEGKTGVQGTSGGSGGTALLGLASGAATGVNGSSSTGYGVVAKGGKAPLRLVPPSSSAAVGAPGDGSHAKGELYLDYAGALFVCTAGGSPGTWRKVSTTLA